MAVGGGIGSVILLVVAMLFGVDLRSLFSGGGSNPRQGTEATRSVGPKDENLELSSAVLAKTEDVWRDIFRQQGLQYREPKLIIFTGRTQSACGLSSSEVGPFYCPGDEKIYMDLSFYQELKSNLGATGDFAQAYVIAHEVGHHIQKLLGVTDRVDAMQARMSERDAKALSVRLELQADFYAGVWAHHAAARFKFLEEGDLEEALNAATAIGDDRLQQRSRGYADADTFTHGTSEQRARWFRKGFETGDIRQGDTFSIRNP